MFAFAPVEFTTADIELPYKFNLLSRAVSPENIVTELDADESAPNL